MIDDGGVKLAEGGRCFTYDYTGSVIKIITVFEKLIHDEIQCVRSLTGTRSGGWLEDI
jgi:hypothetical protein